MPTATHDAVAHEVGDADKSLPELQSSYLPLAAFLGTEIHCALGNADADHTIENGPG
jgi:hypothetical protein